MRQIFDFHALRIPKILKICEKKLCVVHFLSVFNSHYRTANARAIIAISKLTNARRCFAMLSVGLSTILPIFSIERGIRGARPALSPPRQPGNAEMSRLITIYTVCCLFTRAKLHWRFGCIELCQTMQLRRIFKAIRLCFQQLGAL